MEANELRQEKIIPISRKGQSTFTRVVKYMGMRVLTLFVTVVIGVFLTVMIANMGGYVDEIRRNEIQEDVRIQANLNPAVRMLAPDAKLAWMQEQIHQGEITAGLDKPFMVRAVSFMSDALTLDLGRALKMNSDSGSQQVRDIILERLPATLVLFGSSTLILFFVQISIALTLSRHYGSFWDKVFITLAPTSSIPAWFYGIFLILLFASFLKILPFGGMVAAPPPKNPVDYALSLLQHMALPLLALTLNSVFLAVYTWRTFFLIYSTEDYVEMAKAKGLPSRALERDYIMRPTLPTIITNFALGLLYVITGAPIMESIFNWPGLGQTTVRAIGLFDSPVIIGSTVIFAYLLAITVLLLNLTYVIIDPRVKLGRGGAQA
jgi:peptide/nickel transport system permease protein